MKPKHIFLTVLVSFLIFSCSKEDVKDPSTHDSALIGIWSWSESYDSNPDTETYEFRSNGTFILTYSFKYNASDIETVEILYKGDWETNDNVLTLTLKDIVTKDYSDVPSDVTVGDVWINEYKISGNLLYIGYLDDDDLAYHKIK